MRDQDAVERVAKVICAAEFADIGADYAWNVQDNPGMDMYRRQATAAITEYNEILRERAQDADVVEAVSDALGANGIYAGAALTAALDVMIEKEHADDR